MSTNYYIVNNPLPLSQDFKSLKEKGLAYIQSHIGNEWTNLNTSDPGVTILDQVCYALTELGYCNDFPLSDILTTHDDKLQVEDQFYLPENILTTSPVTADDYRKYLIDGIANVDNAVVLTNEKGSVFREKYCEVYLLIDSSVTSAGFETVCEEAFYYLNKARNLGELFLMPKPLQQLPVYLEGTIDIANEADLNKVLSLIGTAIQEYIFPEVTPLGYSKLVANGVETNDIFNGPYLRNGWIPSSSLGKNKQLLSTFELVSLISSVAGVNAVSGIGFHGTTNSSVSSGKHQVIFVDIINSFVNGYLQITSDFVTLQTDKATLNSSLGQPAEFDVALLMGNKIDVHANLPSGKYRDLNSYYSIQNTFPQIYAVGINSIASNAPDYQIAQSRQLKGYLTLFDQVLANQFSQLANVHRLFSFRNAMTGAPSERYTFFARKDDFQKKHPIYPVPYLKFSPTYFYQSLYEIPYIKPLLKDNDTFKFSVEIEPEKVLEQKSWNKYKLDPYNPYMKGLMEFMEDETVSLKRRNEMLDHLLARHGESPLLINAIIDGSVYSGDSMKDKVIFKSLYLQNLGLLSYFRYKAYNYQASEKIADTTDGIVSVVLPVVTPNFEEWTEGWDTKDFIFNSERINWIEKLTEQHFVNYAAIELKLSLLFGLKEIYTDFIATNFEDGVPERTDDLNAQALWFIRKRRGLVMIEMPLLLKDFSFEIIFLDATEKIYCRIDKNLDYKNALSFAAVLQYESESAIPQLKEGRLQLDGLQCTVIPLAKDAAYESHAGVLQEQGGKVLINVIAADGKGQPISYAMLINGLEFLFPQFIPQFQLADFSNRVENFLENELPVNVPHHVHLVGNTQVNALIPAFIRWHESMRFNSATADQQPATSWELLGVLLQIYGADKK